MSLLDSAQNRFFTSDFVEGKPYTFQLALLEVRSGTEPFGEEAAGLQHQDGHQDIAIWKQIHLAKGEKVTTNDQSLQFGLRSIEGGYFRFLNFASHFICLQIFQIRLSTERLILSASKYSRYIFRGRNAQFSIGTRQKKGRVECLWEFQIFYQGIIAQIFGKKYLFF